VLINLTHRPPRDVLRIFEHSGFMHENRLFFKKNITIFKTLLILLVLNILSLDQSFEQTVIHETTIFFVKYESFNFY